MGRFISVGHTGHAAMPPGSPFATIHSTPFVWKPRGTEPRFVRVASMPEPEPVVTGPEPTIKKTEPALTPPTPETISMPPPAPDPIASPVTDMGVSKYTVGPMATLPAAVVETIAPRTPLSQNLLSIRRKLNLTPEEFSRPIIEDGEGLIKRLKGGFSRPSPEITNLICETLGICSSYLCSGTGPLFLKDETESVEKYVVLLARLLETYLSAATFDRHGNQYWKGSLVDDITRLADTSRLDGRGMSKVIRVLFDYLDTEQFENILERFGR